MRYIQSGRYITSFARNEFNAKSSRTQKSRPIRAESTPLQNKQRPPRKMPGPSNTLLIEGSFDELADELAHYIDEVQKKLSPDSANTQAEITPLLEKGQKDEVLKKLVAASDALNSAPEKGTDEYAQYTPTWNSC